MAGITVTHPVAAVVAAEASRAQAAEDALAPWLIDVDPLVGQHRTNSGYGQFLVAPCIYGAMTYVSHPTDPAYVGWDVGMPAGAWDLTIMFTKYTDSGVLTPSIAGTNLAPVNANDTLAYNQLHIVTGIAVASAGKKDLRVTVPAAAVMYLQRIQLRRTA